MRGKFNLTFKSPHYNREGREEGLGTRLRGSWVLCPLYVKSLYIRDKLGIGCFVLYTVKPD